MCYIIEKMKYQGAKSFPWHDIFLAADVAEPPYNGGTAIQTVLFLAFGGVAHTKFLLKINSSTVIKKYAAVNLINREGRFFLLSEPHGTYKSVRVFRY